MDSSLFDFPLNNSVNSVIPWMRSIIPVHAMLLLFIQWQRRIKLFRLVNPKTNINAVQIQLIRYKHTPDRPHKSEFENAMCHIL